MIAAEFADKVLQLLASVGETDEVLTNLDLPLYDYQVLDSMRTVQLILKHPTLSVVRTATLSPEEVALLARSPAGAWALAAETAVAKPAIKQG